MKNCQTCRLNKTPRCPWPDAEGNLCGNYEGGHRIAGTVSVEVPECNPDEWPQCHNDCILFDAYGNEDCPKMVQIEWYPNPEWWLFIPGPTCPAFDTVPNPWADEFPDRPWNDDAEDALIEVQLKRVNRR